MAKEVEVAVAKKVDLHQLHLATHQKINFASKKNSLSEKEVYLIAKEFFKDLLELNYEFTHDELIEELRKTYLDKDSFAKLENFILLIGQMEYSKKQFSQEELKVMLEEMKDIVDHLIQHHQRKRSFMEKLLLAVSPKHKGDEDYETSSLEKLEEEIVAEEEIVDEELIESLRKLINEALKQKEPDKAKAIYLEVKKMYEVLGNAEKKHIYPELLEAAEKIKSLAKKTTTQPEKITSPEEEHKQILDENTVESEMALEENIQEDDKDKEQEIIETKTEEKETEKQEEPKEKPEKEVETEIKEPVEEKIIEPVPEEPSEPLFAETENTKDSRNEKEDSSWTNDHENMFPEAKKTSRFAKSDEEILGKVEETKKEKPNKPTQEKKLKPKAKEKKKPRKKPTTTKKISVKKTTKKKETTPKKNTPKKKTTSKKKQVVSKKTSSKQKQTPPKKKTTTKKATTKTNSKTRSNTTPRSGVNKVTGVQK